MQRGRLARCGVSVSRHASCLNQDSQDYRIFRIILIKDFWQGNKNPATNLFLLIAPVWN